jgi:hypothetical protein
MSNKDTLSEYGPETKSGDRAECGGVEMEDVKPLPYSKPKGPTDQMRARPGLGGEVYPCGTQGKR